ncbi:DNA polymerase III subunit alpha [Candidatus Spyradosoma sp. SGI.093]|uniref:DNA polymerase III subunit alpha n=1 Tax=Candidatus Spyradosoma sp. SGI.093 TaxID=3420583 RepID=UPI003D076304
MSSDLNFDLSAQAAPYAKPAERAPEALREDAPAAGSGGEAPDFVHLHVHSQYSMLDGATRIASVSDKKTKKLLAKGLVQKAKELGMRAVALTDHGNMFGAKLFYDTCRAEKIKPIIGCEVYVARRTRFDKGKNLPAGADEKLDRSGDHLILLAKNLTGYRNLVKLVSFGWTEGFHYRPRVDKELLERYHEGLICSSACIAGEIPRAILAKDAAKAEAAARWYKKVFGDDFYLEIQRHPNSGEHSTEETREVYLREVRAAEAIFELAKKIGVKVVATNDVHFLDETDADAHEILLCLSTGKKLSDENRMRYTRQEWFKSKEEMFALFRDRPETLSATTEIADKVEEYKLDSPPIMPFFPIPESFGTEAEYAKRFDEAALVALWGADRYEKLGGYEKVLRIKLESDYLEHLTLEGAARRWPDGVPAEVRERIDFELNTIRTMGFPGYFLIVQDFIAAARGLGVIVGPGRGSAAGCVVAYCLGITGIDPTKYDLLFERFLNPDRISMPDIDIDFDDAGRQRVLEWVTRKYGQDHVSHIVTFGVMAPKSAIKDVARVLELPLPEANALAKLVPATPKITMYKAMEEVPELKEKLDAPEPLVARTMRLANVLDGTVRQNGVHACGILISRDPLTETIPVMPTDGESLLTTQYDGHFVEPIGLIKMDFLGLRTLTIIKAALANIRESTGKEIDIDRIPMDDRETFELFSAGRTTALFQFESGGMKKHLMALRPNRFEDLVAMNALYRPGPMAYIPQFIRRKHGEEPIVYDHPLMETYLKDTYGITVYQEQVMLQSRALGQFTRGESDTLRKAMGKKQAEMMAKLKEKFISGCLSNPKFMEADVCGNDPKKATALCEKIWSDWEAFAQYAFNKSHSVCYAYVAYQTGWLKAHYPVEFMASVLDSETGNPEKMLFFIGECESMGIRVLGPDVNSSLLGFAPDAANNAIRFGFGGLKGLGEKVAEEIIRERRTNGKYKSFLDFMQRMARVRVVSVDESGARREQKIQFGRGLQALIVTGAFDGCEIFEDRRHLLDSADAVRNSFSKEEEDASQLGLFDMLGGDVSANLNSDLISRAGTPMSEAEKLRWERELLGFYLSGHPLDAFVKLDRALTTFSGAFEDCRLSRYEKHDVRLCGMCSEVKVKTSKDGRKYMTLFLETHTDTYDVFCFSDVVNLKFVTPGMQLPDGRVVKSGAMLEDGTILEDGAVLAIDGELRFAKRKKDAAEVAEWRFTATRISSLKRQVPVLLKKIVFILDGASPEPVRDFLAEKLLPHIANNPGGTEIALALAVDGDRETLAQAELGEGMTAFFPAEAFRKLAEDPAVLGYEIVPVAPYRRPSRFPARERA